MRRLPLKNGEVIAPCGRLEPKVAMDARGVPIIHQERKYKLITPLFGGGVEPSVNDEITPISGKAIRGHLRFWWRAARGGQFGVGEEGLRKLKEQESEIWGAASTPAKPNPSRVNIHVEIDENKKGSNEKPFTVEGVLRDGQRRSRTISHSNVAPPYAAFPLQPPERGRYAGMPTKTVKEGVAFTLKVSFPEKLDAKSIVNMHEEIEAALWAWETFGGIGARTRRGFGALQLVEMDGKTVEPYEADVNEVAKMLVQGLAKRVNQGEWHAALPNLQPHKTKFKVSPVGSVNEVWNNLIDKLKAFRQMRSGTERDPGRSKWPEPDQLRDKTDQMLPDHQDPIHEDLIYSDCMLFPRAAFGLPIAFPFHYQQSNQQRPHQKNRDPAKTKLTLPKTDRWASRLLLRPLACRDDKAVGLALILNSSIPEDLQLVYEDTGERVADLPIQVTLKDEEAKEIVPLDGNKDVLEAFLRFLVKGVER
jgi:CRISPR-associated protein Cmr1